MSQIWTPGMTGPLDELVTRLLRIVERFREEQRLEAVDVEVELFDGARHRLRSIQAEPGFGFLTLVPQVVEGEPSSLLVIPIGAVKSVRVSAPDPEQPFGFGFDADSA